MTDMQAFTILKLISIYVNVYFCFKNNNYFYEKNDNNIYNKENNINEINHDFFIKKEKISHDTFAHNTFYNNSALIAIKKDAEEEKNEIIIIEEVKKQKKLSCKKLLFLDEIFFKYIYMNAKKNNFINVMGKNVLLENNCSIRRFEGGENAEILTKQNQIDEIISKIEEKDFENLLKTFSFIAVFFDIHFNKLTKQSFLFATLLRKGIKKNVMRRWRLWSCMVSNFKKRNKKRLMQIMFTKMRDIIIKKKQLKYILEKVEAERKKKIKSICWKTWSNFRLKFECMRGKFYQFDLTVRVLFLKKSFFAWMFFIKKKKNN